MEKTRVLILSSSTGGGHDMRAQAFTAWAQRERSKALEVSQHQALEATHSFYRFGVDLYNVIQRHAPLFHHLYFNELELIGLFRSPNWMMGKERFCLLLEELRPQVVLSVHGSTNHGFFDLARRTLGGDSVRCVTYCGELFGGYGFSRHWVNPQADLFIGAVAETAAAAQKLGMTEEKTRIGGFLLRPEFYQDRLTSAQLGSVAQQLELDPAQFILLLSTGANGANNHLPFLRALAALGRPLQVIALCGQDEKTLALIKAQVGQWPQLTIRALGKRTDMSELMQLATTIVARPGTGTTSEAINVGCPLLFNGMGGVMPQEWITVKYCRKHGLGEVISSPRGLAQAVENLLDHPEKIDEVKKKMREIKPALHPKEILQMVCD